MHIFLCLGENCRSHRRKCVLFNNAQCERCFKLELECVYKVPERPVKSFRPFISPSRRKKLFETMWMLNNESDRIQLQLNELKSQLAQKEACTCIDPTHCSHNLKLLPSTQPYSQWGLTITSNHNGALHVQTSIQSVSDLSNFVQEAFNVFKYSINIDQFPQNNRQDVILVTNKTLKVELAVRNFVSALDFTTTEQEKRHGHILAKSLIKTDESIRTRLKMHIIKEYFSCAGLIKPLLPRPYYYPILMSNPNSLLATAIVALVAYSKCQHINMSTFLFTRTQFAESCRLEAKSLLEDILFESEPTLEICLALWAISASSTLASKGKESRFQSSICWNMLLQLKNTFIINNCNTTTIEEQIKMETLTRLYYTVRHNEVNFHIICDQSRDFEAIINSSNFGLPTPLQCEMSDKEVVTAINCYRYLSLLSIHPSGVDKDGDAEISALLLFAGTIDEIPSTTIQYLENTALDMWNNIPNSLKLGTGPFHLVNPESIKNCHNPCILRFNLLFYIYWMNIQSRFMQSPQDTDLAGAAFSKIDGKRALIIASICSDAATKMFQALSYSLPCVIKLHWLTMCIEVLERLSKSVNTTIKHRALSNKSILVEVLKHQLDFIGKEFPTTRNMQYFAQIKQIISSYMAVNKICIV